MGRDSDDIERVIDQVQSVLETLRVGGPGLRDAIEKGLRQATDDLGPATDDPADEVDDNVVVLNPDATAEEDLAPNIEVQVVHGAHLGEGAPIRVRDSAWQTLWAGNSHRAYRVRCITGSLRLLLDDALIGELSTGQASDVEGRSIRVQGSPSASGTFDAI